MKKELVINEKGKKTFYNECKIKLAHNGHKLLETLIDVTAFRKGIKGHRNVLHLPRCPHTNLSFFPCWN